MTIGTARPRLVAGVALAAVMAVFLLLVARWQWTVTRIVAGVLVVVGGAALVARPAGGPPR